MESVEKDCSALGNLFQTIINDLRNSSPVWEDFTYKATILHQCLKTALVAISSFLEAFQKVADMATNSRGATKEIGSALTRLCMRHRSIESCLKALTNSVLDSVVAPLQERLEDWKKVVAQLDKDHAKEYKKARQEIKKALSDTTRLQKKVNKGKNEMLMKLDSAMHEVNDKYLLLEEMEKSSVRMALIEERERFCVFISCIKPFVDHEVHLLSEVTHLQEIMHYLCLQAGDPQTLPPSSEQVIADLKGVDLTFIGLHGKQHPSPPSSPSSLGSRKSSVCSMASINSCSSSSSKSHSPGHSLHKQNALQDWGAGCGDSSMDAAPDSGSTPGSPCVDLDSTLTSSNFSTHTLPLSPSASSAPGSKLNRARPHTISAASEKAYARQAVKPELFEPLMEKAEGGEEGRGEQEGSGGGGIKRSQSVSSNEGHYSRPAAAISKMQPVLPPHCPRPKIKAVAPPALPPEMQPDYANTMELHQMALEQRGDTQHAPQQHPHKQNSVELAEAIRELEQSTAALHCTYGNNDNDSHSHSSVQCCSSGYATMDSTPSSSDDIIPPGDGVCGASVSSAVLSTSEPSSSYAVHDSEKYFTLPRSGGLPAALHTALFPARASSAGSNLIRRGSMNTSKPLPPVRRTASISYSSGPRSAQRPSMGGGEGFYAELQTVQHSIQERRQSQQPQQPPVVYSKPGQLQRQHSVDHPYDQQQQQQPQQQYHHPPGGGGDITTPSPDRASLSSGSSEHYAVPVIPGSGSGLANTHLMQSLNAKLASLNQQYQDPQLHLHQQQSGTYVGQAGDVGLGVARAMMPPPAAVPDPQHRGQGHPPVRSEGAAPQQTPASHYSEGLVSGAQYAPAQHYPHAHSHAQSSSHHGGEGMEDLPPPPLPDEDFPLPPSEQELAEMETVYGRPPPVTPKPKMSGDLMMELKRRMSHDEFSNV